MFNMFTCKKLNRNYYTISFITKMKIKQQIKTKLCCDV